MNREILFRAKKVDGGEWVEGYVVQRYGEWFIYDIKMQIRADRIAISLIRIRSVNTPDLQTRREGRYGRTTLLNTIMVIIMLL